MQDFDIRGYAKLGASAIICSALIAALVYLAFDVLLGFRMLGVHLV
jgi:hypothetical protein